MTVDGGAMENLNELKRCWSTKPDSELMLQMVYVDDPWKVMISCILLNQTSRVQVDAVRKELFERWPTPIAMAGADPLELFEVIKTLGFGRKRTTTLKKFSEQFERNDHRKIDDLYGIGKYAADSWALFVEGRSDVEPTDKELLKFMKEHAAG